MARNGQMETERENNFSELLQLLGRALTDALEKLNAWWQKPETQETLLKLTNLPVQMEERLKAQRRYFRRGVLPSLPIVALADKFATVDAKTIAEEYAAALESHA
ncbi:hypothetical protein [Rhizobium terrae]|uniref:hypothetical protein n=1 Tax=Rhizobium terrae TaxID=2171756 RepID=UPI000E3C3BD0|nr:hypothetical protein [Rhizobium terrae]